MRLSYHPKFAGILWVGLLTLSGCSNSSPRPELTAQAPQSPTKIVHSGFSPSKVSILPLTRLVSPSGPDADSYIQAYVTLADEFGAQLKYPGSFRFELYEKILRSAEPKGQRIEIWPDVDLTRPEQNSQYWQDFLRAYEFHLDFVPDSNQKYILQVTFREIDGKRLSGQASLEF
jgi:hypothetical protein